MGERRWMDEVRRGMSLLAPGWGGWARLTWCLRQRRTLAGPGRAVVWVRGPELAWATWGARHGLFEVGRMDGLPYLRVPPRGDGGDVGRERP